MPKRKSDMKDVVFVEKKAKPKAPRKARAVQPEVKFKRSGPDSSSPLTIDSTVAYTVASAMTDLTVISQGVDRNNRVGRIIYATGLQLRGRCSMDAVGVGNIGFDMMKFRMIVVQDKEGGSTPTAVQVIEVDTAGGAGGQADFYGSRQMDHSERFKVLLDEYSPVLPTQCFAGAGNNDAVWTFDKYIKLNNLKVNYSGSTATPVTGNIHVFFMNDIPDKAAHASALTSVVFTARLHFVDP